MVDAVFITAAVVLFLFFVNISLKHSKPVKAACLNMFGGVVCLAASSVIMGFFGISVMINMFTVLIALTLGIPGVAMIIAHLLLL